MNVGADGYLLDRQTWSTTIAKKLAEKNGLTLTPDHWHVIEFLRAFYESHHAMPGQRLILKYLTTHSGQTSVDSIYLHHLFPGGPLLQGALLAGLPKPKRCL